MLILALKVRAHVSETCPNKSQKLFTTQYGFFFLKVSRAFVCARLARAAKILSAKFP
jgi:hypothetical protein